MAENNKVVVGAGGEHIKTVEGGEAGDVLTQSEGGLLVFSAPVSSGIASFNAEAGTTVPPSSEKIRWNDTTQTNATEIYVSDISAGGTDISLGINNWSAGDSLYLQLQSNSAQYQRWEITTVTPNTGYTTLTVVLQESAGVDFATNGKGDPLLLQRTAGGAVSKVISNAVNSLPLTGSLFTQTKDAISTSGWGLYSDSQYTELAPLVINNAKVKLPCNALGGTTNESELPNGVATFWNTTTNKIDPINSGDAYSLRVTFKCKAMKDSFFDIQLDIGDPDGMIISSETKIHPKENDVENRYSFDIPIFSLGTFLSNGGTIFIDSTDNGANLNIYDINIFIARLHKAKGADY